MARRVVRGGLVTALLLPVVWWATPADGVPAPVAAVGAAPSTGQAPLSAAEAAALRKDVTDPVIILLRAQPSAAQLRGPDAAARRHGIAAAQAPVVAELRRTGARRLHALSLVDAVVATVSPGEAARLAANPAVSQVVPDSPVRGPDVASSPTGRTSPSQGATVPGSVPKSFPIPPGACPAKGQPAYLGEELSLIGAASDSPAQPTAHSLGITGTGVKVAYMAEGIDTDNPDFIRPDGKHVFVDYQDFSGDGLDAPTSGGEAFLDASAIASQGKTYDVSHFGKVPLAAPCRVRVEGVAPGASLVGLKVFAQNGYSTTSGLVQAVDYAVTVDHVDVLNESLGYNPFPTVQSQDILEEFNDAAVAAGTTVTVAAGDAGPADTIGSPDTDPEVINVGASTNYRFYAETGIDGYVPPIATKGWLSDNISGLSSGGFEESGPTDDLVAPGDLSFAACTPDPKMYSDCTTLDYKPADVEFSGGTSESSPLTAGTAALVIEAYRHTHGGASPTPALVKRIIVSTADDLGHPATQQGSGLLDAYRAVLAAESVPSRPGAQRSGAAHGDQVLLSTGQLHATAAPGTAETWPLTITNVGVGPTRLDLSTRTLGPALDTQERRVVLSDSGPHFFNNFANATEDYRTATFTVAPGRARLEAGIAYQGNPADSFISAVDVVLIDPEGDFAADAVPQGVGNAGLAEVRYPAAGTWTAVIFTNTAKAQGTLGPVLFRAQTFDFRTLGTVSPAVVTIPAGKSKTVRVDETTPAAPGDESAAVVIANPAGQTSSVAVSLRSLVDLGTGGHFGGVVTGGNGRQPDLGQVAYYQFQVPAGPIDRTLRADVQLADHATDPVVAYLVDPEGQTPSVAIDAVVTRIGKSGPSEKATSAVEVAATTPAQGRWTLILDFAPAITGNRLSTPYEGTVTLAAGPAKGSGLPVSASTTLPAGKAFAADVVVRNTSDATVDYFLDPRDDRTAMVQLAGQSPTSITLPMAAAQASPSWLVPADTSSVTLSGQAPVPLTFDWGPGIGDPDLGATTAGDTATGAWTAPPVTSGLWFADPSELGPYGAKPAPTEPSSLYATVRTEAFDRSVTSPTGDLWLRSVTTSAPLTVLAVRPGATAEIPVTITPSAKSGTVVSGTVYVDELAEVPSSVANAFNYQPAQTYFESASQVAALPFQYQVG